MQGWKTFAFNGSIGALALLAKILAYLTTVDWKMILSPEAVPYVILAIGLANIVLRHVTTGPAGWVDEGAVKPRADSRA